MKVISKDNMSDLGIDINLGNVCREACVELMLRDMDSHPEPELFIGWAKGGRCPYRAGSGLKRLYRFKEKRKWFNPSARRINDVELFKLIFQPGANFRGADLCGARW